ncbi:MAG: YqaA family protein [Arcobacteraceae bacterium]|nr:DedA family protein [Campylobacterales bacterium]
MVYLILFITSLISATLFPLGSEALLLYDIKEGYNLSLLLLFATIGNSLGSVINYFLGLKGEEYLIKKSLLKEEYIIKSKNYFDKYGAFSILFSWLPIVGDPITFAAGILKYDFYKFLILVIVAKFSRYLFLALII